MSIFRFQTQHGAFPGPSPAMAEDDHELWRMANLLPQDTGLPFIVWISSGQGVQHGPRVKIAREMGDLPGNMTSVSIVPPVEIKVGPALRGHELTQLAAWIDLNRDMLVDLWDCRIGFVEAVRMLRKL